MSQPEARIGTRIRKTIEDAGGFVFKVHGGPQMMAGLPDLVCCIQGLFVGIEVKQPGKMPTPRQEYVANMIRQSGGVCIVAHSVDEAIEQIDHLFARNTS